MNSLISKFLTRKFKSFRPSYVQSQILANNKYLHKPNKTHIFPVFHRNLFIQTQSTPNPLSVKFLPGNGITLTENPIDFPNFKASQASPLAKGLFAIEGVSGVLVGTDFISISINSQADWNVVKPHAFGVISDFIASGAPLIKSLNSNKDSNKNNDNDNNSTDQPMNLNDPNFINENDSEVVSLIKELIETRIRPSVQEDGGDIIFKSFNEQTGLVLIQMVGSCKGCSSSSITLKNGIENMLIHYVPEVKTVEEYKDPADEIINTVSNEQLKKLEDVLAKIKNN